MSDHVVVGNRKRYKAYCSKCGRDRGFKLKNHLHKMCSRCACMLANKQSQVIRHRKPCSEIGCDNLHYGKGFCNKHYEQFRRPAVLSRTVACLVCDKEFTATNKTQKYCSPNCCRKMFVARNPERAKQARKRYVENNREKIKESNRRWQDSNREHVQNYKSRLHIKMAANLRSRISRAIRKSLKGGSAIKDLGCSISELKVYLESKFQPGMSWNNYSSNGWHIDHIRPLSGFDLSDPEQLKIACHYSNLQPLWAKDNLKKGDRHD